MKTINKLPTTLLTLLILAAWLLYSECATTPVDEEQIPYDPPIASYTINPEFPTVTQNVQLNASASTGHEIDYFWSIEDKPGTSQASLTEISKKNTSFVPDITGDYKIKLLVTDFYEREDDAIQTITVTDLPFSAVAEAGGDVEADIGVVVQLDGSNSLPDVADLNFTWTLINQPALSNPSLTSIDPPDGINPTFMMDEPGIYEIELYVELTSDPNENDIDNMFVITNAPVIDLFTPQTGNVGTVVTITGKNYSSSIQGNIVVFNGVQATITDASATELIVEVPQGATTGAITVSIAESGDEVISDNDFVIGDPQWNVIETNIFKLFDVTFTNSLHGVTVGEIGSVYITSNGGYNWEQAVSNSTGNLFAVDFGSSTTGYAVGAYGFVIKTTDGGTTWNEIASGTTSQLAGVSFLDENTGYIAGYAPTALQFTDDGGNTWQDRSPAVYGNFHDVFFTDNNHGHVGGNSGVFYTEDGGLSWSNVQSGAYTSALYHYYFINQNEGWIAGKYIQSLGEAHIGHTTDGGINYMQQTSGVSELLWDVFFTDENNGIVVGAAGTVLQTSNGGDLWEFEQIDPLYTLTSAYLFTSGSAVIVGSTVNTGGIILRKD